MTRKEFYEKYGDVKVKFSSYYKYTFTYTGTLPDGGRISVDYGANADDIYRFEVGADCEEIIKFLFSKEIEVAPGVFWLGGYLYENRNKPTTPPPLKWKKRDT